MLSFPFTERFKVLMKIGRTPGGNQVGITGDSRWIYYVEQTIKSDIWMLTTETD